MHGVASRQKGFALPSVIITSLVMFTVLVAMVGSVSSVRVTLDSQYYQALARDASESGVNVARECLRLSNGVPGWSNAAPLTASTDCNGVVRSGCSSGCYLNVVSSSRMDFRVGAPTVGPGGTNRYTSDGLTQLLRTTGGGVWKSYNMSYSASEKLQAAPEASGGAGWLDAGHFGAYLTYNGQVYGFGDNALSQLGQNLPAAAITKPTELELPTGVGSVSKIYTSGQGATILCVITADEDVHCRGKDGSGGSGLMAEVDTWQKFNLPAGLKAKEVYINGQGSNSACVLTTTNVAYCAGDNWKYGGSFNGLLGTGNTTDLNISISAPELFIMPVGITVKTMFVQDRLTCAIGSNDNAYCAGNNVYGTLGQGNVNVYVNPVLYPLPSGRKAKQIVGNYHNNGAFRVNILATDGTIWGSGRNLSGELGNNTAVQANSPVQFGSRTDYTAIITGDSHVCGITAAGAVWCSGEGTLGNLGNGSCVNRLVPTLFNLPAGEAASIDVTQQSARQWEATMILTRSGKIYSAGSDTYGRFGSGSTAATRCSPVQMSMPSGVTALTYSTLDSYSTYFIGSNGFLYSVGSNNVGQLGDGTIINRSTPVPTVYMRYLTIY